MSNIDDLAFFLGAAIALVNLFAWLLVAVGWWSILRQGHFIPWRAVRWALLLILTLVTLSSCVMMRIDFDILFSIMIHPAWTALAILGIYIVGVVSIQSNWAKVGRQLGMGLALLSLVWLGIQVGTTTLENLTNINLPGYLTLAEYGWVFDTFYSITNTVFGLTFVTMLVLRWALRSTSTQPDRRWLAFTLVPAAVASIVFYLFIDAHRQVFQCTSISMLMIVAGLVLVTHRPGAARP